MARNPDDREGFGPSSEEIAAAIQAARPESVEYVWMPGTPKTVAVPQGAPQDGYAPSAPPRVEVRQGKGKEHTANEIRSWIYNPAMIPAIVAYVKMRGFEINTLQDLEELWFQAVDRASLAYMGSDGQLKQSPWDILDLMSPMEEDENYPWKGERFVETTRSTQISEMGPETARAILRNALREAIGRGPTDQEIEDFASRSAAIVSAHPIVTATDTTYEWDPNANGPGQGGYVQRATTQRQVGASEQEVAAMVESEAMEEAREDPEYGQYQASTNLVNWLIDAVGSPV